jgi:voltage-gated potassium channel
MIKKYPLILIMAIVIPSFFICAVMLRVFERPYMSVDNQNFNTLTNSLWCVTITMATIGYGDIYPATNLGRLVAIFCAFWGAFAFSMLVVTLEKIFALTRYQEKAYQTINKSWGAARVV